MPEKESGKSVVQRKDKETAAEAAKGVNYLFVIAIDAYQYCPRLYNCVQDATKLIQVLTEQYDFKKQDVRTLFNEKATEGNIIKEFRKLAQTVTSKDNLVIYFSGHGEYDTVFDEGYWIPVDAQLGAQEDFLSNSDLRKRLNAIPAKHTFLIADSCFSGSLFAHYKSAVMADRLEDMPSRWGLTSGRNEVVSDGQPGDHSPFAESLLYHLQNNKGAIGVASLCNRVVENVIANADQTPRGEPLKVYGHKGGQLFFHPKNATAPKADTPKKGSILYQIPKQMALLQETKCLVRIAFDKAELMAELDLEEASTIKSIRIANLMEVDLLDPFSSDTFQITAINQREQLIDKEGFTQWLFYVKATKAGKFPLLLKVTVIEMLYGKERRKEIVLEEIIEVVTTLEKEVLPSFKSAGYAFALDAGVVSQIVPPAPSIIAEIKPHSVDAMGQGRQRPPENVPIEPPKPKKGKFRGIFKIAGGIAAALLFLLFLDTMVLRPVEIHKPVEGIEEPKYIPEPEPVEVLPTDFEWFKRNGKYGIKNIATGETIVQPIYDTHTKFTADVAFVKFGNKWGLINKKGEMVVPVIINQPGKFTNGLADIRIGNNKILINTKGETKVNGRWVNLKTYLRKSRR